MKRLLPVLVCGHILIAATLLSAAIPEPVKIDTGSISGASVAKGDVLAPLSLTPSGRNWARSNREL